RLIWFIKTRFFLHAANPKTQTGTHFASKIKAERNRQSVTNHGTKRQGSAHLPSDSDYRVPEMQGIGL
ncbi:MAG: hypothetical protein RQ753_10140, partial [Desulfurivibrionaceae bacterium]|nr:hypothetical protein [Desulfurivibrionaceae bacterium]